MTLENRNSPLLGNGSVNIFPRKRAKIEERWFSWSASRCSEHISAAVNKHAAIEEAVFSVETAPRLHNEDLTQLE
jgi:hypothetical protein